MKKILFGAFVAFILTTVITINGCKKDDTTPPTITLSGSSSINHILNSSYTDAGATANDEEDGSVTVTSDASSTNPDVDNAATYTITYTATDAAGNQATSYRTVIVYNEAAAAYAGTYPFATCNETDANGPYTYGSAQIPVNSKPFIVTASTIQNKRLIMNRLGDFDNNTVFMDVIGTSINIPSQTHTGVGTGTNPCDVHDRTTDGTGVKITNGFTLTYNDAKVSPCTGSRTGVVAVFTK